MEHVIMFVSIQMQLQTLLCYSYTYDMIFVTLFLTSNKLYIASGSAPFPVVKNCGGAPG
jgi:hypothetical protein